MVAVSRFSGGFLLTGAPRAEVLGHVVRLCLGDEHTAIVVPFLTLLAQNVVLIGVHRCVAHALLDPH